MDRLKECMSRGAWEHAWTQFRRLTEGEAAVPTAELWYLGAKIERRRGNLYAAAHLISRAIDILQENVSPLHAEVWFQEGIVYREIGELHRAISAFGRVITHANLYPELAPVLLGAAHYNLALAYVQRRDHLLALAHYREAASLFRSESQHGFLMQTLHNMAWIFCLDSNPAGAGELLDEAEPLVLTPLGRAHQKIYRAYCLVLQGSIPEALRVLQEVVDSLSDSHPLEAAALACCQYVAGEACRRIGLLEQALLFASEADKAALKAQDCLFMNLACGLRANVMRMREAAD